MNALRIEASYPCEATLISNIFLDEYMPRANGEFVKIYLYLLRSAGDPAKGGPLSLGAIADRFNYTEQDVLRAFRYWEREGLLALSYEEDGSLSSVRVMQICPRYPVPERASQPAPAAAENNPAAVPEPSRSYPEASQDRRISTQRMKELKENEEIRELLFIAQRYLGKLLSPNEMSKLLYFYDELHFTTDLIEYLIEYCVGKGHTSIRYIEKVGLGWYDEGIRTVKDARQSVSSYNKDYYEILKAIGQGGRHPIDAEIALMRKWLEEWQFPMEIVREACTRTVMNTKQPSLKYTDGILLSWHEDGVRSREDIARLDSDHEARRVKKISPAKPANRFNSFEQRTYDYDALEADLLQLRKPE